MTALTQPERVAAIEARLTSHQREHELNDRIWAAKLDAIDARLRGIERLLLEVRLPSSERTDPGVRRVLVRRDVGIISGSAAVTSLLWWVVDLVRSVASG